MFAPRGLRILETNGVVTFSSSMRMVDGVHGLSQDFRPPSHMSFGSGLADTDVVVIQVADDSNGGVAILGNKTGLSRRHADLSHISFKGSDLAIGAGRTDGLPAFARFQFKIMDVETNRNILQLHAVANFHLGLLAANHMGILQQTIGSDDVAALAISVAKQGDEGSAIGIVFNGLHARGDVELVEALAIDDAEHALFSASTMTHGESTEIVSATLLVPSAEQRLVRRISRQLLIGVHAHIAATAVRWFVLDDSHGFYWLIGFRIKRL